MIIQWVRANNFDVEPFEFFLDGMGDVMVLDLTQFVVVEKNRSKVIKPFFFPASGFEAEKGFALSRRSFDQLAVTK